MVPKMEAFEATLNVEIQSTAVMLSPKDCVQKWPEQRNLKFPPHGESNLPIFTLQPADWFSWLTQKFRSAIHNWNKFKSKRGTKPGLYLTEFFFPNDLDFFFTRLKPNWGETAVRLCQKIIVATVTICLPQLHLFSAYYAS